MRHAAAFASVLVACTVALADESLPLPKSEAIEKLSLRVTRGGVSQRFALEKDGSVTIWKKEDDVETTTRGTATAEELAKVLEAATSAKLETLPAEKAPGADRVVIEAGRASGATAVDLTIAQLRPVYFRVEPIVGAFSAIEKRLGKRTTPATAKRTVSMKLVENGVEVGSVELEPKTGAAVVKARAKDGSIKTFEGTLSNEESLGVRVGLERSRFQVQGVPATAPRVLVTATTNDGDAPLSETSWTATGLTLVDAVTQVVSRVREDKRDSRGVTSAIDESSRRVGR